MMSQQVQVNIRAEKEVFNKNILDKLTNKAESSRLNILQRLYYYIKLSRQANESIKLGNFLAVMSIMIVMSFLLGIYYFDFDLL